MESWRQDYAITIAVEYAALWSQVILPQAHPDMERQEFYYGKLSDIDKSGIQILPNFSNSSREHK